MAASATGLSGSGLLHVGGRGHGDDLRRHRLRQGGGCGGIRRRQGCGLGLGVVLRRLGVAVTLALLPISVALGFLGLAIFGSLAALIARARVLIACNSAPAHIAAATRTPVVVLYALTNLQHTPWQVDSRVLFQTVSCAGCLQSICPRQHHACLAQVHPERVLQAVQELLALR